MRNSRGRPLKAVEECISSVMKIEGLPVINVDEGEKITAA
jgi:hypothetical protein